MFQNATVLKDSFKGPSFFNSSVVSPAVPHSLGPLWKIPKPSLPVVNLNQWGRQGSCTQLLAQYMKGHAWPWVSHLMQGGRNGNASTHSLSATKPLLLWLSTKHLFWVVSDPPISENKNWKKTHHTLLLFLQETLLSEENLGKCLLWRKRSWYAEASCLHMVVIVV